jgi:hypothetical protein
MAPTRKKKIDIELYPNKRTVYLPILRQSEARISD